MDEGTKDNHVFRSDLDENLDTLDWSSDGLGDGLWRVKQDASSCDY